MKGKFEKELRRFLKRKRKITEAVIICFLITGGFSFSSEIIKDDEDRLNKIIVVGDGEDLKIIEDIRGIIVKGDNSNITIQGKVVNSNKNPEEIIQGETGNGVVVEDGVSGTSLINNGEIIGGINFEGIVDEDPLTLRDNANGVMGDVYENSGVIRGSVEIRGISTASNGAYPELHNSGNGIVGSIDKNSGIIEGNVKVMTSRSGDEEFDSSYWFEETGNGVMGDVYENSGIIRGSIEIRNNSTNSSIYSTNFYSYYSESGNGIVGNIDKNSGIIEGNVKVMTSRSENEGFQSNYMLYFIGNGIKDGYVKDNTGLISGKTTISAADGWDGNFSSNVTHTGNGVYYASYSGEEIIKNNIGIIKGNLRINLDFLDYNEFSFFIHSAGNGLFEVSADKNSGLIEGRAEYNVDISEYSGNPEDEGDSYSNMYNSGNGIIRGSIKDNTGIILGNAEIQNGSHDDRIFFTAAADSIGNGINDGRVENNSGVIKGTVIGIGGFNTILRSDGNIERSGNGAALNWNSEPYKLNNQGSIIGEAVSALKQSDDEYSVSLRLANSGNGLSGGGNVELINNGKVLGKGIIQNLGGSNSSYGSGNGMSEGGKIDETNGLISGSLNTKGTYRGSISYSGNGFKEYYMGGGDIAEFGIDPGTSSINS